MTNFKVVYTQCHQKQNIDDLNNIGEYMVYIVPIFKVFETFLRNNFKRDEHALLVLHFSAIIVMVK